MGGLVWYYVNLGQAVVRLIKATFTDPVVVPKRLDQLLGSVFGLNCRVTISRWARHNSDKLYTRPIFWITEPFDYQHVLEIDDTKPYPPSPGFGWALLGNTILALVAEVIF